MEDALVVMVAVVALTLGAMAVVLTLAVRSANADRASLDARMDQRFTKMDGRLDWMASQIEQGTKEHAVWQKEMKGMRELLTDVKIDQEVERRLRERGPETKA